MITALSRLAPIAVGLFLFPGSGILELLTPFVPAAGYVVHMVHVLMGMAVVTVFGALLGAGAVSRIWAPVGREALG
ncbi:MAG: hypothetical protein V3U93_09280 [Alphaproteobacteria bacterium]